MHRSEFYSRTTQYRCVLFRNPPGIEENFFVIQGSGRFFTGIAIVRFNNDINSKKLKLKGVQNRKWYMIIVLDSVKGHLMVYRS
jgi:hypothetical protein